MNKKIIDAIKGGLWGLIVGDALGVPVEFQDREELEKNPVIDMRSDGTHNQPKGIWSDDTSMTLCLVDNLIKGYDLNEIANNFVKWYRYGFMTPYGVAFDVGNTTRKAIYNIEAGVKVTYAASVQIPADRNEYFSRSFPSKSPAPPPQTSHVRGSVPVLLQLYLR